MLHEENGLRYDVATERFARSIGRLLSEAFARVMTECTGHYSQTAARKIAMHERARVAYGDFVFEGRPVFAGIAAPHTHAILFEREY